MKVFIYILWWILLWRLHYSFWFLETLIFLLSTFVSWTVLTGYISPRMPFNRLYASDEGNNSTQQFGPIPLEVCLSTWAKGERVLSFKRFPLSVNNKYLFFKIKHPLYSPIYIYIFIKDQSHNSFQIAVSWMTPTLFWSFALIDSTAILRYWLMTCLVTTVLLTNFL